MQPVGGRFEPLATSLQALDRRDPLELQLAHFCALIRRETEPLVTALDGLQNLRILEAITLAARSGKVVESLSAE